MCQPPPKYPVIVAPESSSESQETKTKKFKKNEINGCACQRPMCHQTPQAYKEPFEQMDSNSCRRGLVPNVPGADVCLPRVPQSESDPTLSRLRPLFSCSSTLHFQSFDPNCLFFFGLTERIGKLNLRFFFFFCSYCQVASLLPLEVVAEARRHQ